MQGKRLPPFKVTLPGRSLAVREALDKIRRALGPLRLNVEEFGRVEIVLAEVLNNIVEHAYAATDDDGTINIHCAHKSDGLHLKITDHGDPMPAERVPDGLPADIGVGFSDTPEGGFGWVLIRDLARDVRYRRVKGSNQLDLRLEVGFSS